MSCRPDQCVTRLGSSDSFHLDFGAVTAAISVTASSAVSDRLCRGISTKRAATRSSLPTPPDSRRHSVGCYSSTRHYSIPHSPSSRSLATTTSSSRRRSSSAASSGPAGSGLPSAMHCCIRSTGHRRRLYSNRVGIVRLPDYHVPVGYMDCGMVGIPVQSLRVTPRAAFSRGPGIPIILPEPQPVDEWTRMPNTYSLIQEN